jgi:hypothetical protein
MQTSDNQRTFDAIAVMLVALISASYFVTAFKFASVRPFWMDEVLSIWTARLPTITAVWNALDKGAEFSPPLYILLLQKIIHLGGGNALMLRQPSIVAVYIVGVVAFILMRRRYSLPFAALAMAICLIGGLFPFALQVRPYACVAACFALALVIWDIPSDRAPSLWRPAAILVLLVIAIGMNFYSVLIAVGMGLMELIWTGMHRRIRWLYVAVIGLAILSILLWLPIVQHAAAFNHDDSAAADYYALPSLERLILAYMYLLVGHRLIWLSPLILLVPAVLGGTLAMLLRRRASATADPGERGNLNIIVVITCALPLLVFFFALEVTHTFNHRYFAVAALGLALLIARLVARLPSSKPVACLLVTAALGISLTAATPLGLAMSPVRALALLDRAPPDLPIVTGNGLRFFEFCENAKRAVGDRIRYLEPPLGTVSPDPTNQHQVERWKIIAPQLAVLGMAEFLTSNSRFLLFADTSGVDLLPALLIGQGSRLHVIARAGDAYLAEVESRTSSQQLKNSNTRQDAALP